MHNLTDKDILDAIKFLIAFLGTLIAIVMAVKVFAKEFGNRGKLIEAIAKEQRIVENDFMTLKNRVDRADTERAELRKDVNKLEADYDSLIDKILDRFKTTRTR